MLNLTKFKSEESLFTAAENGQIDIVDNILNHDIDTNDGLACSRYFVLGKAFLRAAASGHLNVVKHLLEYQYFHWTHFHWLIHLLNSRSDDSNPLIAAAKNNHREVVRYLLSCKLISFSDDALFQAIKASLIQNLEMLKLFDLKRLNLTQIDQCLYWAGVFNAFDTFTYILSQTGMKPTMIPCHNWVYESTPMSALLYFVRLNNHKFVKWLLAEENWSYERDTALLLAKNNGFHDIAAVIQENITQFPTPSIFEMGRKLIYAFSAYLKGSNEKGFENQCVNDEADDMDIEAGNNAINEINEKGIENHDNDEADMVIVEILSLKAIRK